MTAYLSHSAAQLRRAQLSGAKKRKVAPRHNAPLYNSPGYGQSVDHSKKIKSRLANGAKTTSDIAAFLGLADASAYNRLIALAAIGVIVRSKGKGIKSIFWSLPGPDGELAAPAIKPRPYVRTFNQAGRSEKEFYAHRDTAMAARK